MRTLEQTRERWQKTLAGYDNLRSFKASTKNPPSQNPCLIGLRSICWKIFLLFESLDYTTWAKKLADSRSAYEALKDHYLKNLINPDDVSAEDPLSDNASSLWHTLQQDEDLQAEIFQDVERCMPESAYFREPSTQKRLLHILFIYCKLNRDISYRQGMHEVLAPILWVVYCDAIDPTIQSSQPDGEPLLTWLDQDFIEHDAFTLFAIIMQAVRTFYEVGSSSEPITTGLLNHSPIVERSKRVHEVYLQQADPELAEHLTAIEILPQIFLIRWIRLLFGREFPLDDVLALWDSLFAEDPALDLVDLISVSMLLRIRWQLLDEDYTGALTLLLRYPTPAAPHGPETFVTDALYLRDNLLLDGGDHIISKYSNKSPETTVTRKLPKKVRRARLADREAARRGSVSESAVLASPASQKGIESIIQDAARGLYHTGEKWGVARAIKGAVQGLQAANASPLRSSHRSSDSAALLNRIERLEERNSALSKMLAKAMDELWTQHKDKIKPGDEGKDSSDSLSLAIAKVQFVQVYLENSSMQLPAEKVSGGDQQQQQQQQQRQRSPAPASPPYREAIPDSSQKANASGVRIEVSTGEKTFPARTPIHAGLSSTTDGPAPDPDGPQTPTISKHKVRPSLTESPYSWMLGEEQTKSDFVPTSPFLSGQMSSRGKRTNLFGDSQGEAEAGDEDIFMGRRKK